MIKFVTYLGLVLWIVYFFLAIYLEYRRKDNGCFKDIIKKPFRIIRIESILFLVIFLVYRKIAREDVLPYLYFAIVITNVVYLIYDILDNYGFLKIKKQDYKYIYVGLITLGIIGAYFLINKDIIRLNIITLCVNICIPSVISFMKFWKKN